MILKEYAKKNDLTLAEAKELTGLTHWKQTVPEEDAEVAQPTPPPAPPKPVEDEVPYEVKRKSVKGLGERSPYWNELKGGGA
jgi:hypothetical protein